VFSCFVIFSERRIIDICWFQPRYYQGICIYDVNYYFVTDPNYIYTYAFWPRPFDRGACWSYISHINSFLCHLCFYEYLSLSLFNEVSFWSSISIISCYKHKIHLVFLISFYPRYCFLHKYEYIFDLIFSLFDYLLCEYSTHIEYKWTQYVWKYWKLISKMVKYFRCCFYCKWKIIWGSKMQDWWWTK
jgi:hypothetical protein